MIDIYVKYKIYVTKFTSFFGESSVVLLVVNIWKLVFLLLQFVRLISLYVTVLYILVRIRPFSRFCHLKETIQSAEKKATNSYESL